MPRNDHTAFEVSNMESAIRFYTEKLGLKLVFSKIDEAGGEAYAFLELEGGNLELIQLLDEKTFIKPRLHPPYCPHLAFTTDDMSATLRMLAEKGVPLVAGPFEIAGAEKWVYLADPDNNVIEFIEWIKGVSRKLV